MSATADAFNELKKTMESYAPISPETWAALVAICKFRTLSKQQVLYALGEIPPSFSFVYSGLFRSFITDEKGAEYNKNFFLRRHISRLNGSFAAPYSLGLYHCCT